MDLDQAGAWSGGYYEASFEVDEPKDSVLDAIVKAVWDFPGLEGCYLHSDLPVREQARETPSYRLLSEHSRLYGIATAPNGARLPSLTFLMAGDDGPAWLGFGVPMEALSEAFPDSAGFPFEGTAVAHEALPWRRELDDWLFGLVEYVYSRASFSLALVGFEAMAEVDSKQVRASGVPAVRWVGVGVPAGGALDWHPANHLSAQFSSG